MELVKPSGVDMVQYIVSRQSFQKNTMSALLVQNPTRNQTLLTYARLLCSVIKRSKFLLSIIVPHGVWFCFLTGVQTTS